MRVATGCCLMFAAAFTGCRSADRASEADWAAVDRDALALVERINEADDVVTDNIANAETTAYKAVRTRVTPAGVVTLSDMENGGMESTDRPFDLAISGNGFFRVRAGGDILLTRDGNFFVNNAREIVLGMGDGYRLEPPIAVPERTQEINVSQDGIVQVLIAGELQKTTIGTLELAVVLQPERLERVADSALWRVTEAAGSVMVMQPGHDGTGSVLQGFLEGSNVDLGREKKRREFLNKWRDAVLGTIESPAGGQR